MIKYRVLRLGRTIVVGVILATLLQVNASAAPKAKEISFWNDSEEQSLLKIDNTAYDKLLKKYVRTDHPSGINRFDYNAVSEADKASLDGYLNYLQQMDPRQLTKARQKAFWINLYNATLLQRVLESNAEDSVRELGRRLWRSERLNIAMQKISLDDIEHGILRPIFNDPRVHFALSAGALGSACIQPQAYTAENVEQLLAMNTKKFLNHPRGVSFDGDRLVLSSIFKWYRDDFGGDFDSVKTFLTQHLDDQVVAKVDSARSAKYDYAWTLNKP